MLSILTAGWEGPGRDLERDVGERGWKGERRQVLNEEGAGSSVPVPVLGQVTWCLPAQGLTWHPGVALPPLACLSLGAGAQ